MSELASDSVAAVKLAQLVVEARGIERAQATFCSLKQSQSNACITLFQSDLSKLILGNFCSFFAMIMNKFKPDISCVKHKYAIYKPS